MTASPRPRGRASDPDFDISLMINAAANLRLRGQSAAADRLEAAACRLWHLRHGAGSDRSA